MKSGKGMKWWIFGGLALAAAGAAVGAKNLAPSTDAKEKEAKTAPQSEKATIVVTAEPVADRSVRRHVSTVGSLWGWEEIPLTPKVEGRVLRIYKDLGDIVKPGDLLLELDPTDYQLAVNEATRALELELAKLGLKELPGPNFDVSKLPSVVRADSLEKLAQTKAKRLQAGGRAVSEDELQQALTDVEVTKANSSAMLLEAQATLAMARQRVASLDLARQRLADTKIVVPTPSSNLQSIGLNSKPEFLVSLRKVTEGEMVRIIPLVDAPPLFRLILDQPLKLQLTIPERHRSEVKVGQTTELEVESYPGEKFLGQVSRINPAIDRASRSFSVEVIVPNQDRRLSAGSFAKASIITKKDAQARTVPEEAIVQFAGVIKVFLLVDGKAKEVPVKLGAPIEVKQGTTKRTWIEVVGDIPEKAQVITSGQTRLAEGSVVTIRGTEEKR